MTVLWEMEQLRAIARTPRPHSGFRRRASWILRTPALQRTQCGACVYNLSWGISISSDLDKAEGVPEYQDYPAPLARSRSTCSDRFRPQVVGIRRNQWAVCIGISGLHLSESMVGMDRITHPTKNSAKSVNGANARRFIHTPYP